MRKLKFTSYRTEFPVFIDADDISTITKAKKGDVVAGYNVITTKLGEKIPVIDSLSLIEKKIDAEEQREINVLRRRLDAPNRNPRNT